MSAAQPEDCGQSIATVLAQARQHLGGEDAQIDCETLLCFVLERPRSYLYAWPERLLGEQVLARYRELLERRCEGEAVAYITGAQEFWSLLLRVSSATLVPRPETERLVELALEHGPRAAARVLDLGTGSGAIALALKHGCPDADVTGCDASAAALAVARRNGARLALAVRFVESHWFAALAGERFELIVGNPPYVRSVEVVGALEREPRLALDGGSDGLDAYRAILAVAARYLEPGGLVLLEHGHDQRAPLGALADTLGWRVAAAHDDLAGRARVLAFVPKAAR